MTWMNCADKLIHWVDTNAEIHLPPLRGGFVRTACGRQAYPLGVDSGRVRKRCKRCVAVQEPRRAA